MTTSRTGGKRAGLPAHFFVYKPNRRALPAASAAGRSLFGSGSGVPTAIDGEVFAVGEGGIRMGQIGDGGGNFGCFAETTNAGEFNHGIVSRIARVRAKLGVDWARLDTINGDTQRAEFA